MSKKKVLILGIIVVLALAGFVLGQSVNAVVGSPGDQSDPLVTKSYIDAEVTKLQTQIDSLKADVEQLKSRV